MKRTVILSVAGAMALVGTTALAADVRQGLVAYWPFDTVDLVNNVTPDVVSTNHMTLVNITDNSVLVPGKFGQAISFTAASQQVAYFTSPAGVDTGLPISASAAFSILLWVNANGTNQSDLRYFCESSTLNNNPLIALGAQQYGTNGFTRIYNRNGAGTVMLDYTTTNAVLEGNWHHVAEIYNGGAFSLYIDGQLRSTNKYSSLNAMSPINTTSVGGIVRAAIDHWTTSQIDDLALWSRALSQGEIQNVMTNSIQTPVPQFAPLISVDPIGATNLWLGDSWTLNAGANGTRPLGYQWLLNGAPIAGATTTTLTFTNLAPANSGAYAFVSSNSLGSATSAVAALTVTGFSSPNITNGLVSYWPLDTIIGTKTPDLISGYDMTVLNMTTAGNIVPGKWGNAFSFTNATQTILERVDTAGQDLPIYNKANFTISMWVNGAPNQTDRRIWSEGSTAANNQLFNLGTPHGANGGGYLDSFIRNNSGTVGAGTTPPGGSSGHYYTSGTVFDNTWHNLAYVQRVVGAVTNGYIYVDGVLDPVAPDPVWPLTLNTTSIGGILRSSPSSWFQGFIDEVAVWSRALTPTELQILQVTSITNPPTRLQPLTINSFLSDLPAVVKGGSTVLRWDVSSDAGQVTITPNLGDVTAKTIVGAGTNAVILTNTTTFVITVKRGTGTISATNTVAVVSGVAPGWTLLDNFDTYLPGALSATPWWRDLRGTSVQIADFGTNRVMTTLAADSDAVLNLQTNAIQELQFGTLFFRMILPVPGTTTPAHVVGLTDVNARSYSDVSPAAAGGTGPAVFPTIMSDPVGGTNAWFLGAHNGIGAGVQYTPSPLTPGAVYDVWIQVTNAPWNDPLYGFTPDTFWVYLQMEGDPVPTLVFDTFQSDRNPNYIDVILGGMQPNLNKLIVAGNDATISASFDDFYLASGAFLTNAPRAFGYTGGPLPALHISTSGGQIQIQWTAGTLQQASAIAGPWSDVSGATLPSYSFTPTTGQLYFRARP